MRTKLSFLWALALIVFGMSAISPTYARPNQVNASDLHALLTSQLGEHVILAANATNAAVHGRNDEFKAAADALDTNSVDLSKSIALVYGQAAGDAFLPLWRKHIGFFVDYTQGVAAKDQAKQDKALSDLTQYAQDFGAFLNSANPNLPKQAVVDLLAPHVTTLTNVIKAQAADDYPKAYASLREAYGHMDMIGNALAGAIAKQFPDKFAGAADAPDSMLRATLTKGLEEHVVLAASATNAALHQRDAEFKAAADALDGNSVDLSKAIGSVYGQAAGDAFLPLWRKHIGFFVDYTQGVAAKDQAKQDKAIADLTQYAQDFGAFLNSANPNLPKQAVVDLLAPHVTTLTNVIKAQGADDYATAYSAQRTAYAHMSMIADPLAAAIVTQFPDKFGGATTTTSAGAQAPAMMPNTGGETTPWVLYAGLIALAVAAGATLVTYSRRSS